MRSTTEPRGHMVPSCRALLLGAMLATSCFSGCGKQAPASPEIKDVPSSSGDAPTAPKSPAANSPTVDESLSYAVASKNIKGHIGKRVAWQGSQVTYSTSIGPDGKGMSRYVYLTDGGLFVFSDDKMTETPAATKLANTPGSPGVRTVSGTIASEVDHKDQTGRVSKIPYLSDVTVDAPKAKP